MSAVSVSVVVTAYNSEHYLLQSLTSVASQTFQNFELIVIDDGSDRRCGQTIVEKFSLPNGTSPHYFYKKNGGPSSARNYGLSKSRGEFVAFLDADDIYTPDKLEVQVKLLSELPEQYGCVVGAASKFTGNHTGKSEVVVPSELDGYLNLSDFFSGKLKIEGTPGYLFRRTALEAVNGYDESLHNNEDFDLLVRLGERYKIRTHHQIMFHRRLHPDSLSKGDPAKTLTNSLLFISKYAATNYGLSESVVLRRKQRAYFNAAFLSLKKGRVRDYKWLVKEGVALCGAPQSIRGRLAHLFAQLLPVKAKNPGIKKEATS